MTLQIHTVETAGEKSAAILRQVNDKFGFTPNLMGIFAGSPELLEAYLTLSDLVDKTTLSPLERQIAYLATSVANDCDYCVAAHTTVSSLQGLPSDAIQAVRNEQPLADAKLEALRKFAATVTEKRGFVSEDDLDDFKKAGYSERNILEVILVVGMKTLSNYTNHIAETPLDAAFEPTKWHKAAA